MLKKHQEILQNGQDFNMEDIVQAGLIDGDFYGRWFFPQTCRQPSPEIHREMDDILMRTGNRLVGLESFRGSAKTSRSRLTVSKRIGYAFSRTMLFISDTADHSTKTIQWVKKAVQHNTRWAQTFGLKPGNKWTENDIEIIHEVQGVTIRLIGLGITGQIRGINVDDYRPDFILVDDAEDEENTATPEQRQKLENLLMGSVLQSLVPASENPFAMMALLGTPLHKNAQIEIVQDDPAWVSRRFSCFDKNGESVWPERWSTQELLRQKESYVRRNLLSVWLREMECKVTSPETAAFRAEWLQNYDVLPDGGVYFIAVDPAPILSDIAKMKGLNTDPQAVVVIYIKDEKIFLVEYSLVRDQNPQELASELFRLKYKYNPRFVVVEAVAYQRNLQWYLRDEMKRQGRYFTITDIPDRRSKIDRIRQNIIDRASNHHIHVKSSHTEFIEQYTAYPDVKHDDLLDGFSMAIQAAAPAMHTIYTGENLKTSSDGVQDYKDDINENYRCAP